jgi:hypothetical protein
VQGSFTFTLIYVGNNEMHARVSGTEQIRYFATVTAALELKAENDAISQFFLMPYLFLGVLLPAFQSDEMQPAICYWRAL